MSGGIEEVVGLNAPKTTTSIVIPWKLSFKTETDWDYLEVTAPEELKIALLGGYQFVIDKFGASWFRRPKRIVVAGTPISQRQMNHSVLLWKPRLINEIPH